MNNQPQADTPLLAGADPTPGPAGIHTPEGQLAVLREWANQYQGGSFPETVAAKVCSLLIATEPLDLAAVQADLHRVVHVLLAFGGRLACMEVEVNGPPDE